MLFGIALNSILDIHVDALYLIVISLIMLLLSRFASFGKFLSAVFLGMCIHTESESMKTMSSHGKALHMKSIVNGIVKEVSHKDHSTQCVLEGNIDTPQWSRIEHCRILLRIYNSKIPLSEGMYIQARGIASNPVGSTLQGEFNQARYVQSNNVQFLLTSKDISIIRHANIFHATVHKFREWIEHTISTLFPISTAPIVSGIVLGETSHISPELRNAFASLGTAHILSVSGFHAGIIALMILFLLSWIRWLFMRNLLLTISLLAFLELVHWDPPAMRACMMTALAYMLYTLQRKPHPLHVLLTIGGLMICFDPAMLSSIGFQLSMIGMIGLILLPQYVHPLHEAVFPISIAHALSSSMSAILALLPITAWYFGMISLIAPLSNMIFIPIFTIALCWIIIALLCFPFSTIIAKLFALAAHQFLSIAEELHITIATSEWIAYRGEFALWTSCFICCAILIVYRSRSIKQFLITSFSSGILLIGIHDAQIALSSEPLISMDYHARSDIIMGNIGENILFLDRDRWRFTWNDKALIKYILHKHKRATIIYSGKSSKKIAKSIHQLDSTLHVKECDRSSLTLCMNIIKQSIASTEEFRKQNFLNHFAPNVTNHNM